MMKSQTLVLFALTVIFLALAPMSSPAQPLPSNPTTASPNDLTFQAARLKFYSLLAVNYSYIGMYRIFKNITSSSSSSPADLTYECNISVTDGYDRFGSTTNAQLTACFNLTSGDKDGSRTVANRITNSSALDLVIEHLSDWNSDYQQGRDQTVSSIARLFSQIGDDEATSLPDPERMGAYFDTYQYGAPSLVAFRVGAEGQYETRLQILTFINISATDYVREQSIAIWNDRQETWFEQRPLEQYHFDLTIFRGTKDELEQRSDINGPVEPTHCSTNYLNHKDDDPNAKPLCLRTYRIGVTRMTSTGDKTSPSYTHFDPRDYRIYRIIDVQTNQEVHNVTQQLVEDGVYLTIEQHLSRLNLAINISDNLDDENSFFAEYDVTEGYPVLYSWRNPFHNWFEHVPNSQYNVIKTWRITDYKKGPLDAPGPHALAIAAVVLIVIAVIIIVGCGVLKLYRKVIEDSKYGNKEQNQVVRSIEGGNGPVTANDIDMSRNKNNSNSNSSANNHKYSVAANADDLPDVERVDPNADFDGDDDFEMHNTSAV